MTTDSTLSHVNLAVLAAAASSGILVAKAADLSAGSAVLTGFGVSLFVLMVAGWAAHRLFA